MEVPEKDSVDFSAASFAGFTLSATTGHPREFPNDEILFVTGELNRDEAGSGLYAGQSEQLSYAVT